MRYKLPTAFVLAFAFWAVSLPAFAHHGNAAFDAGKQVTIKGIITEWVWANPHSYLKVDVKDDKGNIVHWYAEASNPADMMSHGWTARSFKVGDEVTLKLTPAKNGAPVGRIDEAITADGKTLGTRERY